MEPDGENLTHLAAPLALDCFTLSIYLPVLSQMLLLFYNTLNPKHLHNHLDWQQQKFQMIDSRRN